MQQQESIYNIIPKEKIIPGKDPLYKSQYPYWIAPTASTFILKNTSYPNVANMNGDFCLPRGAHPIVEKSATMGRPEGGYKPDPLNYHKKGNTYRILPPLEKIYDTNEIRKPSVPTVRDKPIMGLKTDKNYIVSNVVDNILMAPKKLKEEEDGIYKHKSFGVVPTYIKNLRKKVEEEYKSIKEMQRRQKEEEDKKQRLLTEEEVSTLREGLRKKWEMYNQRYAKMTHKKAFDNLVLLRNKEGLEKELGIIEGDLNKLDSKNLIIDYTK